MSSETFGARLSALSHTTHFRLLLIIGMALVVRLTFFVGIGFNDDSYYLEFAEKIYKGLEFNPPPYVWPTRFGVYLPVVLSWKLFGISEFSTSLFSLMYSIGSVVVTYLLGSSLFNDTTGLTAAFLMALIPIDVIYSTQVGPDVPFQFFSALSALFFLNSLWSKTRYKATAFLCGLAAGVSQLFKEPALLILALLLSYGIFNHIKIKMGFIVIPIPTRLFAAMAIVVAAFAVPYIGQDIYLHKLTGEHFFAAKAQAWTLKNDRNRNDDFELYPRAMLNMDKNRFEWIHSKPLLGLVYYFVLAAIALLALRGRISSNEVLVIAWLLVLFLFFQYGLHLMATKIVSNGMRPRHLRFLIPMSIPAALIIARALDFGVETRLQIVRALLLAVFAASSIYYTYQDRKFLRNGMGYVRETASYVSTLEAKRIYIPDFWTLSKISFFLHYDDRITKRLTVYECGAFNCNETGHQSGRDIHDAYVVTYVSPYTYINTINNGGRQIYPRFMIEPPPNWRPLKTIEFENYGIFGKYKPTIFYAP